MISCYFLFVVESGKLCGNVVILKSLNSHIKRYMDFLGEHKCKLDDKGRLRLPSALKQQMNPTANGKFVINRGFDGCLELYPMDYWVQLKKVMDKKLNKFNSAHREFYRRFTSGATELILDGADRINFPKHLMEYADIKNECYLTPGQNTIEVWSVQKYEERINNFNSDAYQDIANEVMGNINLWEDESPKN